VRVHDAVSQKVVVFAYYGCSVNRVLRKTLVPKKEEVTERQRKFYGQDIHNLWISLTIVREPN
jgi:hypothetical protein